MQSKIRILAVAMLSCVPAVAFAEGSRLIGCQGRLASPSTTAETAARICPWPAVGGDLTLNCDPAASHLVVATRPAGDLALAPLQPGIDALTSIRLGGSGLVDVTAWLNAGRFDCAFETFRSARAD